MGGFKFAPEIDVVNYKKFDSSYLSGIVLYVLVQFIIALTSGSLLLFLNSKMENLMIVFTAAFTISTLLSCGALLENKNWKYFEYGRLIVSVFCSYLFKDLPIFQTLFISTIIIQISSLIWFYFLQKSNINVKEIPRI